MFGNLYKRLASFLKPTRVFSAKPQRVTPTAKPIGTVTHYYDAPKVAVVRFKKDMNLGKRVRFFGATTDFIEELSSFQHNHKQLKRAPRAKLIGVKVRSRVRSGDGVYEA